MKQAIAERKHAEEAIRENAQLIRAIFEQAPLGIAVINSHTGQFIAINSKYCEIAGFSEEEMLSRTFQSITHPEDLRADLNNMKLLLEGKIESFEMDKRYIRKDDSTVWVRLTVVPLWWGEERPRMHIAMVRDITERKWAEEALRASEEFKNRILESSLDCIKVLDLNGHLLFMNVAGQRQMEIHDIQQFCGRPWVEFWKGEYRQAASAAVETAKAGGIAKFVGFCRTAGGKEKWWDVYITPILGLAGKPERLLSISRDITERKRAEEERRDLYERLQDSHLALRALARRLMEVQEEERHRIARELHDEIGQALTAAKINIQQAMHALGGPAAGTHLEESVSLMDHTLQQVRNLALDLRPSLLDDLGLVPTLKWLVERHAQASEIAIRFDFDQLGTRALPEIELACYRVAQEALTNAIRHARATQTTVELRKHGQALELTVSDDGVGFDPDDMLMQAREGGSIGLLGMKERVSLVEGQVEIQSTPGQGTRIRARLPLRAPT